MTDLVDDPKLIEATKLIQYEVLLMDIVQF